MRSLITTRRYNNQKERKLKQALACGDYRYEHSYWYGTNLKPNWHHVGIFLGLTFGLTWLLDLAIFLRGGLGIPGISTFQQLQTLLPAFSAIVLGLFFFPESPIYRDRPAGKGRWFYYYFLLLAGIYALGALGVWFSPTQITAVMVSVITQVLALAGLFVLIVLRFTAGHEAMASVWLTWGNGRTWLIFGLGIVVYYILQVVLNALFGMGGAKLAPVGLPPNISPFFLLIAGGIQSVLLAPILFIVIYFGEEFGWRGYLQSELFKLGRVRGVLLLSVIWGVWHWPVILMGVNYPGHPALGLLLMTLYATGNAVILSYAVLRSGSILLAAYLHGLIDQVINFLVAMGFRPHDPAFSFGIGIYGIVTLAIIAILLLRDPLWQDKGNSLG